MRGKGTNTKMNYPTLFGLIILAAAIHASFQLSVSALTLLSGHALGAKTRHKRVISLMTSFTLGAATMAALLVCSTAYIAGVLFGTDVPALAWSVSCGLMGGVAVAVWTFYYRSKTGTALWLPRPIASMLHSRITATKYNAESFSLGLTSVLAELLFTLPLLLAAAFALIQLPTELQVVGVITYVVISAAPLACVTILVGGGHRLSAIQKWREDNKRFVQFIAGGALFILGFFIYVNAVLGPLLVQGGS